MSDYECEECSDLSPCCGAGIRDEALEEAAEVAKKWAWDRHLEDCSGCGGRETIGDDVAEAIRALKKLPDISARPQPPPPARP